MNANGTLEVRVQIVQVLGAYLWPGRQTALVGTDAPDRSVAGPDAPCRDGPGLTPPAKARTQHNTLGKVGVDIGKGWEWMG